MVARVAVRPVRGRLYRIEKIQYVTTDSPPTSVYRYLAFEFVHRIARSTGHLGQRE